MTQKLSEKGLAWSLAIVSVLTILLLGVGGNIGVYSGAAEAMQKWHMFFSLSVGGIIAGMIEAGILGFIAGWLIALIYNKFA